MTDGLPFFAVAEERPHCGPTLKFKMAGATAWPIGYVVAVRRAA
jgi:hypothetical protein